MTKHASVRQPLVGLPLVVLLAAGAVPLSALAVRFAARPTVDLSSLPSSLAFATIGAAVSAIVGGGLGALAGTLQMPGRRWALGLSAALLAAPPAFWWIGVSRLPLGLGPIGGALTGGVIAGLLLAPITLLLVLAAAREIPSNAYESARVSLGATHRLAFVLVPLMRPAVTAGFLLTAILLLGESEIPFLFGFGTSMTDVVTTFSQTFDAGSSVPIVVPLVITVLILALLMVKPLFAVLLSAPASGRGVIRKRARMEASIGMFMLPAVVVLALGGYAYAWAAGIGAEAVWRPSPQSMSTVTASIAEPVMCAVASTVLAVFAVYPLRRSSSARSLAIAGLLLFCVPPAIPAIGWIAVGQTLGGVSIPPAFAYVSRTIGLPLLAFLIAYSRLPASFDDASRLVPMSSIRRACTLVLPLLVPTLAAATALTAALIFADRDVASLLLAPGESRLMLNLYLLSANAPSAAIGYSALAAFSAGAAVIATAGAAPFVLLVRWRG